MLHIVSGVLKASRKVEVHFVDFGNREVVACEELRDMPGMILDELPVQAVACCLYGIDQTGRVSAWSREDMDMFSHMVCDKLLDVYFTADQNCDGHCLVHLMSDQENVNRKFLRATNKLSHSYLTPDPRAAGDNSLSAKRKLSVDSNGVEEKEGVTVRDYKYEVCSVGEQVTCVAAYIVSPGQFYLHKNTNSDALDAMMDELNAEYENYGCAQTLTVSVGQPCCALYNEDSRWYRAKLVSISDERRRRLSVEFVDYGNRETVDVGVVHRLRSHYFTVPVSALHCKLAGVAPVTGSQWSDDTSTFFEELLGDGVHAVTVVSVDGFVHTVEMKSVAQKLIERGLAKQKDGSTVATLGGGRVMETSRGSRQRGTHQVEVRQVSSQDLERSAESRDSGSRTRGDRTGFAMENDLPIGPHNTRTSSSMSLNFIPMNISAHTNYSVVVSWVVSPSEFYCQLIDNRSVIEKLSSDLRDIYKTARDYAMTANECAAGRSCVAFYKPDASWYRGRIVLTASDLVTVSYVDYGNTEVVPIGHVRRAAPQFLSSPPVQAVKCCVREADKQAREWTTDEKDTFDRAVSAPGLMCRFVEKRDDVYIVELSDQSGHDLMSKFSAVPGKATTASSETGVKSFISKSSLKQNDVLQLEVVYVAVGGNVFNCHIVGQTDDLDELMAELADDCQGRPALSSFPNIGEPCAALYSEDNGWYRTTVDGIPADDTSQRIVKFVDYGNIESCSMSSLRELDSRFLRLPVQRVDCRLHGMTSESLDDVVDDLLEQRFTATVIAVSADNIVTVELKSADSGESFADTHTGLFTQTDVLSLPVSEPPRDEVDVYVTHAVSPSDFYIQTASVEPQLTQLLDQLMEQYDSNDSEELAMSDMTVGSLCCARYAADGSWYRAALEDVKEDTVSVRFVDYGNSDVTSRSDVRRLTDRFTSTAACAWHCQLADVSSESYSCWTDAERQQFVDLAEAGEKMFVCHFVSRSQSPYPVILRDGEVDIGQQLFGSRQSTEVSIGSGVSETVGGLPVADAPSGVSEVCVTSSESPSDFYVQLTSVEDELSQMADDLVGEYDGMSASECQLSSVHVGSVCCARYSADSLWYRAVVTEIVGDDEVRVLFTDYGNTDVVSASVDVKQLTDKFRSKPAFVYHCALAGLSRQPVDNWPDEVKARFQQLTVGEDEVAAVFSCEFVSCDVESGLHLVSLKSADDVDVCSMFTVTSDVTDTVEVTSSDHRDVTRDRSTVYVSPTVISPGKHRVSLLSLSVFTVCGCAWVWVGVCVGVCVQLCMRLCVSVSDKLKFCNWLGLCIVAISIKSWLIYKLYQRHDTSKTSEIMILLRQHVASVSVLYGLMYTGTCLLLLHVTDSVGLLRIFLAYVTF